MRTYHGKHIYLMTPIKFLNLLELYTDQVSISSNQLLRILYFALVYPYLQYCITVWESTYSTYLNRIVVLQKRVLRIIDK
jgi:hypothetical protein